jgi:hypothetical protein
MRGREKHRRGIRLIEGKEAPGQSPGASGCRKSRNRKIAQQFCLLRQLRLQITATYIKYARIFTALASSSCTIFDA